MSDVPWNQGVNFPLLCCKLVGLLETGGVGKKVSAFLCPASLRTSLPNGNNCVDPFLSRPSVCAAVRKRRPRAPRRRLPPFPGPEPGLPVPSAAHSAPPCRATRSAGHPSGVWAAHRRAGPRPPGRCSPLRLAATSSARHSAPLPALPPALTRPPRHTPMARHGRRHTGSGGRDASRGPPPSPSRRPDGYDWVARSGSSLPGAKGRNGRLGSPGGLGPRLLVSS